MTKVEEDDEEPPEEVPGVSREAEKGGSAWGMRADSAGEAVLSPDVELLLAEADMV